MHLPGSRHFSHQPVLLLGEGPVCRNSPGGLHRPSGAARVRARGPYVCVKMGQVCVFKGVIHVRAKGPYMCASEPCMRVQGVTHVSAKVSHACVFKESHMCMQKGHVCVCKCGPCMCAQGGHTCACKGAIRMRAKAPDMLHAGAPDVCTLGCFPCACGPAGRQDPSSACEGVGVRLHPFPTDASLAAAGSGDGT